jgi:hypothetical protein
MGQYLMEISCRAYLCQLTLHDESDEGEGEYYDCQSSAYMWGGE